VPVRVVERRPTADFSSRVWAACAEFQPDLIILGGWLHRLEIPPAWAGRVLNIHPSLLPAFGGQGMYGMHVHEAVWAAGVRITGCTVHIVDNDYDTGPIVAQAAVPIFDEDTPADLAARVFAAECELYPYAIRRVAAGVQLAGRRVVAAAKPT
jgi:phosphoribosylglycinamide formyltransferase 1